MPTFHEAVTFTSQAPRQAIRLVKSGEFFRAYNRSAWLFQSCITEYKVLRKYVKSLKEEVFYVGCPSGKLLDLIDGKPYLKTEWGIDIQLPEESLPDDAGYDTWKAAVEVEPESKGDFLALPVTGAELHQQVCQRILAFPLESKSMVECAVFLSELRRVLLDNV